MWTGFSIVRIFRPFRSSGALTGRLLLVMCRKPFSAQPSALMPFDSNFASISCPIGPSSTARACALSRNRNGMSRIRVSGTKFGTGPVDDIVSSCVPSCTASIDSRSAPIAPA